MNKMYRLYILKLKPASKPKVSYIDQETFLLHLPIQLHGNDQMSRYGGTRVDMRSKKRLRSGLLKGEREIIHIL